MPKIPGKLVSTYWQTLDGCSAKLYLGNVEEVLGRLPARSVQCVVTSPPYWGLRSYLAKDHEHKDLEIGSEPSPDCGTQGQAQCGGCYVCRMVAVFRALKRALRDDGTFWLNLGDTYGDPANAGNRNGLSKSTLNGGLSYGRGADLERKLRQRALPAGNIVGIPWRVALALQADGWVLRQEVIWHKPSPMPEPVRNRCTKSHEQVFLLAKSMDYYYDAEAIKERTKDSAPPGNVKPIHGAKEDPVKMRTRVGLLEAARRYKESPPLLSNRRSVWTISSQGYNGAHFPTFPSKLVEPCILAGTSAHGCCANCGTPWRRVIERVGGKRVVEEERGERDRSMKRNRNGITGSLDGEPQIARILGWEQGCDCRTEEVQPCIALDPFVGSGTMVAVALEHGRYGWGIDLSEDYLRKNAVPRVEGVLLDTGRGSLIPRKVV